MEKLTKEENRILNLVLPRTTYRVEPEDGEKLIRIYNRVFNDNQPASQPRRGWWRILVQLKTLIKERN